MNIEFNPENEIEEYKKMLGKMPGTQEKFELTQKLFDIHARRRGEESLILPSVSFIVREINESMGRVSVKELAQKLNYSCRHTNRIFVESMGIGPKEYCSLVRMKAALLEMVLKPKMENSYFIEKLNYSDQAHFQREFKKYMKMTPVEFRKKYL